MNTGIPTTGNFRRCRRQRGSAVLIFLTLLSIMLVLVAANGRTLNSLKREIRLIEQRQVRHWQLPPTNATNAVTTRPQTTAP